MVETLTTAAEVVRKAGVNANATAIASTAMITNFINEAEGVVCVNSRIDWVTKYAAITANYKQILNDTVASLAAMELINYDMSGYTSRNESRTMLNVLRDKAMRGLSLLRDAKQKEFLEYGA